MKKAALITGGSDRIGKAIALSLADLGYHIALHYSSSAEKAEQTKLEIKAKKVECEIFKANLNNTSEVIKLFEDIRKIFEINILINNASIFYESSLRDDNYSNIDNFNNVNFRAPYLLSKLFANYSKRGLIINLLDAMITKNYSKSFDYLLSKKALGELTKMSAKVLGPDIRVNGIAPGIILAPKGKEIDYISEMAQKIPLRKTGSIYNITDTVKYFVQNDYITGQIIYVDGGKNL